MQPGAEPSANVDSGEHEAAGEDLVVYERRSIPDAEGSVALLTLNRPGRLNAINWAMLEALDNAISLAEADADVRAILLTGSGRAFSAGGDLESYQELQRDPERFPAFVEHLHTTFGRLRTLKVPCIALVNGVTAAGGLELLLNCDLAIASESAKIGDGHLNFGQMGGGGVLTLLPRYVGIARATELILTGDLMSAHEAADIGLVTRVVSDDSLLKEGLTIAASIALKSPLAVANAKYVLTSVWWENASVPLGLKLERERNSVYCLTSDDAPEGLLAFIEKRAPRFTGR
jgi:enoyl-CoA hydratase/carnithine racemase